MIILQTLSILILLFSCSNSWAGFEFNPFTGKLDKTGSGSSYTDAQAQAASGWIDAGTTVRNTTTTDAVAIGTTTPVSSTILTIAGDNVQIGLGGTNNTATSAGELYIVADLEVDGTITGDGSGLTNLNLAAAGGWTDGGTTIYNTTTTDNVGIGTTIAGASLVIGKSDTTVFSVGGSATGRLAILNQNTTVNNMSQLSFQQNSSTGSIGSGALITAIHSNHTNGSLTTGLNFTTRSAGTFVDALNIVPAGNVGIGTSTPNTLFQVGSGVATFGIGGTNNTATGSGDVYVTSDLEVDGTATINNLGSATTLNGTTICLSDGTNCPAAAGNGWTDGGANVYTSVTTDTVGLGTTTPSASLEIVKQSTSTLFMASSVATGDGDYMIIKSSGNVGIGTILPGVLLDVLGQARVSSLSFSGAAGQTNISNANGIAFDSNSALMATPDLVIAATTNTGIGTSTPSTKLQVVGTVTATSFAGDGSALTGIGAGGWTDGGTNVYTATTTDRVGIGTTTPHANGTLEIVKQSSLFPLKISSAAGQNGNLLNVDSNGNVGIGTINPISTLNIITAGTTSIQMKTTDTGSYVYGFMRSPGSKTMEFGVTNDTDPDVHAYVGGADANTPLSIVAGDSDVIRLTTDGNVGIGTSKPSKRFVSKGGDFWIDQTNGKLIFVTADASCSSCGPNDADVFTCASVSCPAR